MGERDANIPTHVGIIMDGNGRWAKKRGLPRIAGHTQGARVFGDIARYAGKTGVKYLTVYAFSTENWRRPRDEINGIMNLMRTFLNDSEKYRKDNIRLRALGSMDELDADIREKISYLQESSKEMTGLNLNIALNYGGRDEILRAAKQVSELYASGGIKDLDSLDEAEFSKYLYTVGIPDVDLVIRTSGEMRTSNFMIWQSAYAEYIFSDVLWPDFQPKHFDDALAEYARRTRRLGGI